MEFYFRDDLIRAYKKFIHEINTKPELKQDFLDKLTARSQVHRIKNFYLQDIGLVGIFENDDDSLSFKKSHNGCSIGWSGGGSVHSPILQIFVNLVLTKIRRKKRATINC